MTPQKMLQIQAKIVSNTQVAENYFKMCLDAPVIAQKAEPGQFIYVQTSDRYQPLLRRAFSVHRINHQSPPKGKPTLPTGRQAGQAVTSHQLKSKKKLNLIEILYKLRGIGTKVLAEKKVGEKLDIIGPLGKGFRLPTANCQLPILIGGGIGIAPLLFLAEKLRQSKIIVLLGAKTDKEILCKDEFEKIGCNVKVATDDGSQGFKGKVTELLKNLLSTRYSLLATHVYACGPTPMLKEIAQISQQYKIPCQVSLEEKMACGIGACRGCVIKATRHTFTPLNSPPQAEFNGASATRQKTKKQENNFIYKRVCKDGPVFKAQEIIWE